MLNRVKATINRYKMLADGDKAVVALSGGADSVCLLLTMIKLGYQTSAVHINHHLRGEESDRDMRFCEKLCEKNGVSLEVRHVDVTDYSRKNGVSVETAARELRYGIFAEYENFARVATAHTAGDCLETTLFNLSRGTALKGLCGIPAVRGNLIRPLIEITRAEIEEFLNAENQNFVTDSTNNENEFSRNKIRHFVVPQLESVNPSLMKNYLKARESIRCDEDFLNEFCENVFTASQLPVGNFMEKRYDLRKILANHKAVRNRVYAKILNDNDCEVSFDKISQLEGISRTGGNFNAKKDLFFTSKDGILSAVEALRTEKVEIPLGRLSQTREISFCNRNILLEILNECNINGKFTNTMLDCDKIIGTAVLRNRRDGDKINLVGRSFTSSVKKLFNADVPASLRASRAVIEDGEGVAFVEGFGCADRCKIDGNTKKILVFHEI